MPAVWVGLVHRDRGTVRCPPAAVPLVPPRHPPPRRHQRRPVLPPTFIGHSSPCPILFTSKHPRIIRVLNLFNCNATCNKGFDRLVALDLVFGVFSIYFFFYTECMLVLRDVKVFSKLFHFIKNQYTFKYQFLLTI